MILTNIYYKQPKIVCRLKMIAFSSDGIGEDQIRILRTVKILLADDSGPEIPNWYRRSTFNIHRIKVHRTSEFELYGHGREINGLGELKSWRRIWMRVGGGSRTSLCSNFGDFGFGRVFETTTPVTMKTMMLTQDLFMRVESRQVFWWERASHVIFSLGKFVLYEFRRVKLVI